MAKMFSSREAMCRPDVDGHTVGNERMQEFMKDHNGKKILRFDKITKEELK